MPHPLTRALPRLAIAVLLSFVTPAVRQATAEIITPLSIEQLTARADIILHGSVVAMETKRDDAGRIFTRIEFAVEETWKGELATNRFAVVQGGGVLGDRRTTVTGQAEFKIGERLVMFLVLNARGEGVTIGLAQGKFNVVQDAASGETLVRSAFHGGGDTGVERGRATPGPGSATRLTLGALKQRVKGGAR